MSNLKPPYKHKRHWPVDPKQQPISGKILAICGHWLPIRAFTLTREDVECKHCLFALEREENEQDSSQDDD